MDFRLSANTCFLILQTNLQFNNNKYYLIQLLEDDSSKMYSVWMRWGRGELTVSWWFFAYLIYVSVYIYLDFFFVSSVGKVGQKNLTLCDGDLLKAKDIFKKKWDFTLFFKERKKEKKSSRRLHVEVGSVKFWNTCLFCRRFLDKTKNEWEHRGSFEKVDGKYDMVFVDYSSNEKVRLWIKNQ